MRMPGPCIVAIGVFASLVPPAAASGWSSAASMGAPRAAHTATLLPNGKVLVTGGGAALGRVLASAELYDPATSSWSSAGNMAAPRAGHTATLLPNGKVLVAGGTQSDQDAASVELYDPATNTWSPAARMGTARTGHTATLLSNGKVLVAGGWNGTASFVAGAELYDPATDVWSPAGTMTVAPSTATLLPTGKVLVAGTSSGSGLYLRAELYDPATNVWSPAAKASTPTSGPTATLLRTGKVLFAGGGNGAGNVASAELYDPATNRWSRAARMSTARSWHTATLLSNGMVLVAGAIYGSASAELYDPALDRWFPAENMVVGRYDQEATLLPSGQVLITGGMVANHWLAGAELYTPPDTYSITITRAGSGSGTVTSSPPGIDCGSTCSAQFGRGQQVTLSATPDRGSTFAGWSGGGCAGAGTCTVSAEGSQIAIATFNAPPRCTMSSTRKVTIVRPEKGRRSARAGALAVKITCSQIARVTLRATLTDTTTTAGHRHRRTHRLATIGATAPAERAVLLRLRLPAFAIHDLVRGARQSLTVTLAAANANGASHTTARLSPLTW